MTSIATTGRDSVLIGGYTFTDMDKFKQLMAYVSSSAKKASFRPGGVNTTGYTPPAGKKFEAKVLELLSQTTPATDLGAWLGLNSFDFAAGGTNTAVDLGIMWGGSSGGLSQYSMYAQAASGKHVFIVDLTATEGQYLTAQLTGGQVLAYLYGYESSL